MTERLGMLLLLLIISVLFALMMVVVCERTARLETDMTRIVAGTNERFRRVDRLERWSVNQEKRIRYLENPPPIGVVVSVPGPFDER